MRILAVVLLYFSATITTCLASDNECSLYLAESSSSDSEHPKWGIYAGTHYRLGSLVGAPEVGLLTHNLVGNSEPHTLSRQETLQSETVKFFEEFIWVAHATAGKRELPMPNRIVSAIPGAGVLGGFNAKLTNADWDHTGAYFKAALGEEPTVPHPGRGAYSPFYNVTLRSTQEIPPGAEIFLDYGENWVEDESDEDQLNKKDFEKVDQLVNQMIDFFNKYEGELTQVAKTEIYDFLIRDIMNAAAGAEKAKQIYLLLPKTADELIQVKKAGGALMFSQPSARRDVDWLKVHGMCMDHLEVRGSTVPHAGRGAFAKRDLAKGTLVSPAPLVQIPDKSVMNMYQIKRSVDSEGHKFFHRVNDEVIGQQLLLNYCYGHPESSMLLYPTGSVTSFINHSKEPNVKMQFSSHLRHEQDWLQLPPKDLIKEQHAYIGLIMEIVALRDIQQGEEIFLDYGDEWQAAWDAHVSSWETRVQNGDLPNPWPLRAVDMNQEYKTKPFPTVSEGTNYPENINQMCFLVVKDVKESPGLKQWTLPREGVVYDDDNLFLCRVLEKFELVEKPPAGLPFNYTIEWYDAGNEEDGTKVIDVPHRAIVFVDKAETSDQFVKDPFRHYIGIPDDVFPKGPWRNLV